MVDLSINLNGLILRNPVMTASGTFGYGEEFADFIDVNRLGGIVIKGITRLHREGNPYPRMVETASGMLNSVGLQNKGIDYFVSDIYPRIKNLNDHIIVNVSGTVVEDFEIICEKLNDLEKVTAIEVNISCTRAYGDTGSFMPASLKPFALNLQLSQEPQGRSAPS